MTTILGFDGMRSMGSHREGRVWCAITAMDSSNCGFLVLHRCFSTKSFFGTNLFRHSASMLFTTWASCTAISSQKTFFFLAPGTCGSLTLAPHSYMIPRGSFAARATPVMRCLHRAMPLQSSSAVPSVTTVRGLHLVHAAHAMASRSTGGRSAASCT